MICLVVFYDFVNMSVVLLWRYLLIIQYSILNGNSVRSTNCFFESNVKRAELMVDILVECDSIRRRVDGFRREHFV